MEPWRTPAHGCCGCCCCSRPTGTGRRRSSRTAWRSAPVSCASPTPGATARAVRLVEPHRLVVLGRRWYLVAWDVERHDWRSFRVDRMTDPARPACASGSGNCPAVTRLPSSSRDSPPSPPATRCSRPFTPCGADRGAVGHGRADRHLLVPAAQECRLARLAGDDPRRRGRGVRDRRTAGARRAPPRTGRRFTRAGNSSAVFG